MNAFHSTNLFCCCFSVSRHSKPFNRLSPESGNRKKVDMQRPSPRFWSKQFSYGRYAEKRFPQIYRDLYGDAMLVPIRMGSNMAAWNQKKHLSLSFATKGWIYLAINTFSNTWTVQIAKFPEISHLFNEHDCSLGRHVNAASRKSFEIQA